MGTKNNPGVYDCYQKAEPDEPMFILLGRDKFAGSLVRLWVKARLNDGEQAAKLVEALDCAELLDQWVRDHPGYPQKSPTAILNMIPTDHLERELDRRRKATQSLDKSASS